MSRRMFKYLVPIALEPMRLELPFGSNVVSVGCQNPTEICLWAEVDPTATGSAYRTFTVIGTGENVPHGEFLGTVQDGALVWHVYEVPTKDYR